MAPAPHATLGLDYDATNADGTLIQPSLYADV